MPMSREKDETVNVSHSLADVSSKFPPRVREERDVLFFPLFFSEKSRVFVPLTSSKKKWISLSPARDIMGGVAGAAAAGSSSFSSPPRVRPSTWQ